MTYAPASNAEYVASEYSASLADGAELDSGWIDFAQFDKYQCEITSAAGIDMVITSSAVAGGGRADDLASTTPLLTSFHLFNVICRQRYIRIQAQNNSGGPLTEVGLAIKAFRGASDKLSVFPLATEPSNFSQAALVQSVIKGQQPDGDYVNTPADGSAFESTAALAGDAVYLSPWTDSDGWNAIAVFLAADVPSAWQGVDIEFTDDTQAGSPVVRATKTFTFKDRDVERGFLALTLPPLLDGFRVRFTNGATGQASFYASATLHTNFEVGRANDAGARLTADFHSEVALGNISNYELVTVAGRNPDVDPGVAEDVCLGGGDYTGQPASYTPETVEVRSTDTDDDGGGTGATAVRITGLKTSSSVAYETEDITMNGTTYQASVGTWWRVHSIEVITAGSTGENQGTITCRATTTTTNVFATITAGLNKSQVAAITIPAGKRGLVKRLRASIVRTNGSAGSATVTFRTRATGSVYMARAFEVQDGGGLDFAEAGGQLLEAGTDCKWRVEDVSDSNTVAEAAFEILLLDV